MYIKVSWIYTIDELSVLTSNSSWCKFDRETNVEKICPDLSERTDTDINTSLPQVKTASNSVFVFRPDVNLRRIVRLLDMLTDESSKYKFGSQFLEMFTGNWRVPFDFQPEYSKLCRMESASEWRKRKRKNEPIIKLFTSLSTKTSDKKTWFWESKRGFHFCSRCVACYL